MFVYVQGQRQDFGSGVGGGTSDKISYMISSQVLYCNGVAKISVREDIQQKCTYQRLENFLKISKKFAQKFNKFSKFY